MSTNAIRSILPYFFSSFLPSSLSWSFFFFFFLLLTIQLLSVWVLSQLCLTLCNPLDCSPPGSSGHSILQARTLEWFAMPSSRGFASPNNQTHISCIISCIAGVFFTTEPLGKLPDPIGECYFDRNGKRKLLALILIKIVLCFIAEEISCRKCRRSRSDYIFHISISFINVVT